MSVNLKKKFPVRPNQKVVARDGKGGFRVVTVNEDPSATKQSFRGQCDIKQIVMRYNRTGLLDHLNPRAHKPVGDAIQDFTNATDFQAAQEQICGVKNAFEQLPPQLRAKFKYRPENMLDYLSDKDNYEEAVSLGLLKEDVLPEEKRPSRKAKETLPPKHPAQERAEEKAEDSATKKTSEESKKSDQKTT